MSTTTPEPVDLSALRDRAQIYVVGLEAKVRQLREENDRLRADAREAAEKAMGDEVRRAYHRGWKECSYALANATQQARNTLSRIREAAFEAQLDGERAERRQRQEAIIREEVENRVRQGLREREEQGYVADWERELIARGEGDCTEDCCG